MAIFYYIIEFVKFCKCAVITFNLYVVLFLYINDFTFNVLERQQFWSTYYLF